MLPQEALHGEGLPSGLTAWASGVRLRVTLGLGQEAPHQSAVGWGAIRGRLRAGSETVLTRARLVLRLAGYRLTGPLGPSHVSRPGGKTQNCHDSWLPAHGLPASLGSPHLQYQSITRVINQAAAGPLAPGRLLAEPVGRMYKLSLHRCVHRKSPRPPLHRCFRSRSPGQVPSVHPEPQATPGRSPVPGQPSSQFLLSE